MLCGKEKDKHTWGRQKGKKADRKKGSARPSCDMLHAYAGRLLAFVHLQWQPFTNLRFLHHANEHLQPLVRQETLKVLRRESLTSCLLFPVGPAHVPVSGFLPSQPQSLYPLRHTSLHTPSGRLRLHPHTTSTPSSPSPPCRSASP